MAAEKLNMEKLEDLKRQVESLDLDEKQRNKLITEKWPRMREAEAEERRIAAEEKKAEFEVEKLRLELKAKRLSQSQNGYLGATAAKRQLLYVSRHINPFANCSFKSYT